MFWHGPDFSRVERLCISSFLAQGHPVRLHVYEPPANVPAGTAVLNAAAVLPEKYFFRQRKTRSPALFADWFRYSVLYEQGGIWADTDVVCLQPLEYASDEVFAKQEDGVINNAVLGLPAGHELARWMAECCERPNRILPYDDARTRWRKWRRRLQGNRRRDVKWGESGPIGFTAAARHLGYEDRALPFWHFYPVHYRQWAAVFEGAPPNSVQLLARSRALHLWNEMIRRRPGFDKNGRFPPNSLFEQLCARYLTNGG